MLKQWSKLQSSTQLRLFDIHWLMFIVTFFPSQQGDLVSIHSEKQNELVATLTGGRNAWLGGFRTSPGPVDPKPYPDPMNNEQLIWIDGTFLDYDNWDAYQPDNYMGLEFCLLMYERNKWNDQKCNNQYGKHINFHVTIDTFVCQCDLK